MLYMFDMGGVITTTADSYKEAAALVGLNEEEFRSVCMEGDGKRRDLLYLLSIGSISAKEALKIISKRTGKEITADLWHLTFHPERITGMREAVMSLREKGNRVICATNTMESHYLTHIERGDYAVFDQVYASHLMGTAKPESAFFKLILNAERTEAKDAFFTDDRRENCQAACSVGIKTYLFDTENAASSVEKLKETLKI